MEKCKLIIAGFLLIVCAMGGVAQEGETQSSPEDEFPMHFAEMFRETLQMTKNEIQRIREELESPDLTDAEKEIMGTITEKIQELQESAKRGLELAQEKSFEKMMEAEREMRRRQMKLEVLFRRRGKISEISRLTREAKDLGVYEQAKEAIDQVESLHEKIIALEEEQIELEQQIRETVDIIFEKLEEVREN